MESGEPTEFTLEYWLDGEWYVGRLKELPGVFSQGRTLDELERNVGQAYRLMSEMTTASEQHFRLIRKQLGLK